MRRTNEVAVLDIGSKKVTVLIGEKNTYGLYDIKGVGEYDYAGFSGGEWLKDGSLQQAVANAIGIAEAEAGEKIKKLYIGVPSEFLAIVVKEVSSVFTKPTRITDLVIDALYKKGSEFKNEEFAEINCSALEYCIDGSAKKLIEPRGLFASRLDARLSYIMCESRFVRLFDGIAADLGLKEIEYVSIAWAQALGLLSTEQRDRNAVIIDIGYITGSVALVKGDGLLSLSSFSVGGGHIAANIYQRLNIPYKAAAEIQSKIDLNLVYSDEEYHEVQEDGEVVCRASAADVNLLTYEVLDYMADLIKKSIELSGAGLSPYAEIFLTGGGISELRGAKEFLSATLEKPIEILTPGVPRLNRPFYSSTVGLLNVAVGLKARDRASFIKKLIAKLGG